MAAVQEFVPVILALLLTVSALPSRPGYIECIDSSECNPWECCQLGMGRFSLPKCVARPDVGETCRLADPTNSTVIYPDGQVVQLPRVYLLLCPCARGLDCHADTHRCQDPAAHSDFNLLK